MPNVLITPSILSCDLTRLQEEIDSVATADALQIDVMDGHFVPNLTFGAPLLQHLQTKLPLDIHLMVSNPSDRVDEFVKSGARHITFHVEAVPNPPEQRALIAKIRGRGCTAGIALNPDTPCSAVQHLLPRGADLVLCMTVQPGFAGKEFRTDVLPKIDALHAAHPKLMIQVDGGVDERTARLCKDAGATNLVAASAIFEARDRRAAIEALRRA